MGYEQYDIRLWSLRESLTDAVTSADGTDHIAVGRSRLPRSTRFAASGLQIGLRNSRLICGSCTLSVLLMAAIPAAEVMSQMGGRRGSRVIRRQADPDRRERQRPRTGNGAAT